MVRLFFSSLLLFASLANAQFADDFNRADELLDASANWVRTEGGVGADTLEVDNNRIESNGVSGNAALYLAPDQGSPDMYAEADWLGASGNNEVLLIRVVDLNNWVGIGNLTGNLFCRSRLASTNTDMGTRSSTGVTRVRIEAQGTTIRCYAWDTDAVWELFHEETGFSSLASATRAGFRSTAVNNTDGVALWDNYETGVLADGCAMCILRLRHE